MSIRYEALRKRIPLRRLKIFKCLSSTYRLGRPKLKKPHRMDVWIGNTILEFKFTKSERDLMFEMYKIVSKEMELNLREQRISLKT